MPLFLLSLFGGALKRGATVALGFLGKLNIWQLLCIGLALFAGLQTIRVSVEKRHSHKVETQLAKVTAQLNAISSKRSEQRTVTKTNIIQVTKLVHDADKRAQIVEKAPLPGNCKTPPEIMGADL